MDTNKNNLTAKKGRKHKLSNSDEQKSVMPKYDQDNQEKYDSLPDDVLIRIIKYLPIIQWPDLELVDRKFQHAVYGAWRDLRKIRLDDDCITTNSKYESNEILKMILEKLILRAPNLISINGFDISRTYTSKIDGKIIQLLTQFKFLTSFSIFDGASMSVADLAQFLATSASRGRLNELNVKTNNEKLYGRQFLRDAKLLRNAFENISGRPALELEKLNVEMSKSAYNFLDVISVSLLTKLDLLGCQIFSNDLASLIDRCLRLEEVRFNFQCPDDCQGTQTNPHETLIEALKNLENLSVLSTGYKQFKAKCKIECDDLLDSKMVELMKYFGRYRRITDLSLTHFFNDRVLEAIGDIWPYLTKLNILLDESKGDSIKNLMERLINLKKLEIFGQILLEDHNSLSLPLLTNLKQLKRLRLDDFYIKDEDGRFADMGFESDDLTKLENLKELHIQDAFSYSSRLLYDLNADVKWKLESLELPSYKEKISKEFLSFIKKMTDLRRLDLSKSKITDENLQAISKACPLLAHVNLGDCRFVTKKGIKCLIDGCPELESLQISSRISQRGLKWNKYRNLKLIKY